MRVVAATAVAALVAVCAVASATPNSGLAGHVLRACDDGRACAQSKPMRATLVFTKQGVAVRVRAGLDGAYRAALAPGIYRVSTYPRITASPVRVRPGLVRVRAGHVDELDFALGFGIP